MRDPVLVTDDRDLDGLPWIAMDQFRKFAAEIVLQKTGMPEESAGRQDAPVAGKSPGEPDRFQIHRVRFQENVVELHISGEIAEENEKLDFSDRLFRPDDVLIFLPFIARKLKTDFLSPQRRAVFVENVQVNVKILTLCSVDRLCRFVNERAAAKYQRLHTRRLEMHVLHHAASSRLPMRADAQSPVSIRMGDDADLSGLKITKDPPRRTVFTERIQRTVTQKTLCRNCLCRNCLC